MTLIALALATATLTAAPSSTQPPAAARPPIQTPAPVPPPQPRTPEVAKPADTAPVAVPFPFKLPTQNVKVDVTITERAGSGTPVAQTVSLIVADDRTSKIRTFTGGLPFNVDAKANITPERRVLLELAVMYTAFRGQLSAAGERASATANDQTGTASTRSTSSVNNQLTLLLTPGVSTVAARNADTGERVVTIEVMAEILK